MRIKQILNNNAVIVYYQHGHDKIVIVKGVGFGKKTGQKIDAREDYQVFTLTDQKLQKRLQQLIAEISGRSFPGSRRYYKQ